MVTVFALAFALESDFHAMIVKQIHQTLSRKNTSMRTLEQMPLAKRRRKRSNNTQTFKMCSMCHKVWADCERFVTDPELTVNGYQAFFDNPADGLILFTHRTKGCRSTLALKAAAFKDLYRGPKQFSMNFGAPSYPEHRADTRSLEFCETPCSMKWVRDVLQLLRAHRMS
jgi:hypothetical protein